MQRRQSVLLAAQPAAAGALERLLDPALDVVRVHTMANALHALDERRIDAIVCTILFDESRMMEFLQAVKASVATSAIPFICARVLRSALSDRLVDQLVTACRECGATDFLDLAAMDRPQSRAALSAALRSRL